jgi:alpha-maltose-1-phosphate synthase
VARERPDVVYVQQGVPRVYEIVNAIIKSGYSCRYVAGYYYRENGWFERLLHHLPGRRVQNMTAALKRRHLAALPADIIERSWMLEVLLGIERVFKFILPNFAITRMRYLDIRGAIRVLMIRPKIVIASDSHALYTLRAAKRVGAVAVLDQVIGHVDYGNRILSEEKALRPELGSTFRPNPGRLIRRCIKEVQEAEYILVPSDYVKDSLLPFGADPDRIFMLPYGVDLKMFAPSESKPPPPFKILFAGHIGIRKGVYYLLEAVRQAAIPGVQVVLLGNIEGDGKWLEKYQDLFVHRRHLPHQEIPAVFADAHIYAFPSLHEGSTVSIYEAMASGLPVVTTPNAGSVVRDGTDGYIVPIRDIAALRDRIERLYQDAALRETMGRSAAVHANQFSWDAYSERIGKILGEILEDSDDAGGKT